MVKGIPQALKFNPWGIQWRVSGHNFIF